MNTDVPSSYLPKGHSDESHFNGHNNTSRSSFPAATKSATLIVQENRQKAAKMLISVVIIFAICYMPVHVFNLFRYIEERKKEAIERNFRFLFQIHLRISGISRTAEVHFEYHRK